MSQVQILDETICISLHANALGKGMNPYSFPSYGQIIGLTGSFSLVMVTSPRDGKHDIQTNCTPLKN